MANHRWDTPNSKVSATCVRCGILRICVSKRYAYSGWEYILNAATIYTNHEQTRSEVYKPSNT